MIGKTPGHYRVVQELGRGGVGEVYLTDDLNLNRKVALRFFPDAFTGDAERMARFEREATLLASLKSTSSSHNGVHMKLPSVRQVYLAARRAVRRFPFVLFCMLAGSITALILIESEWKQSVGFPIIFAAARGFPLLTALALFAEKRKWSPGLSMGGQLWGVLLLVGYGFSVPTSFPHQQA
jgi:serine/threonine protein kinase